MRAVVCRAYGPPRDLTLADIPNRQQAIDAVRTQGAKVLVGCFNPSSMTPTTVTKGWLQLGGTPYYVLPLNLHTQAAPTTAATLP